jgi:hypothetical protein
MIKIYDCETGETLEREMTAQEKSAFDLAIANTKKADEERDAKEAARLSALAKLEALGLTSEEIKQIVS